VPIQQKLPAAPLPKFGLRAPTGHREIRRSSRTSYVPEGAIIQRHEPAPEQSLDAKLHGGQADPGEFLEKLFPSGGEGG
jgi:hypothetical protein